MNPQQTNGEVVIKVIGIDRYSQSKEYRAIERYLLFAVQTMVEVRTLQIIPEKKRKVIVHGKRLEGGGVEFPPVFDEHIEGIIKISKAFPQMCILIASPIDRAFVNGEEREVEIPQTISPTIGIIHTTDAVETKQIEKQVWMVMMRSSMEIPMSAHFQLNNDLYVFDKPVKREGVKRKIREAKAVELSSGFFTPGSAQKIAVGLPEDVATFVDLFKYEIFWGLVLKTEK